jgi:hypothetical protein
MLSAGEGVATFGREKADVAVSAGWATGFVAGVAGAPNPGNAVVAPPNKGLGRAGIAPSGFSPNCGVDEGVRLNGSGMLPDG